MERRSGRVELGREFQLVTLLQEARTVQHCKCRSLGGQHSTHTCKRKEWLHAAHSQMNGRVECVLQVPVQQECVVETDMARMSPELSHVTPLHWPHCVVPCHVAVTSDGICNARALMAGTEDDSQTKCTSKEWKDAWQLVFEIHEDKWNHCQQFMHKEQLHICCIGKGR